jgi:pyruvate dehydrogenase E1 component beta subunit
MAERILKYWQAVNEAIAEEMERDPTVVLFGEDVAAPGGTFGETRGLLERFGASRVRDTPISEQAIVGAGVGAAAMGLRPIAEILFVDFLMIGSDQLVNQAAKLRFFSGGRIKLPLVIKAGVGTEFGMGAQHSQALEGWFAQVPGLTVCWPSTPTDAKALMKAAVRHDGPVLYLESFSLLRTRGAVAEETAPVELGEARVVRSGSDVTLVTYGSMPSRCVVAAERLGAIGVDVEVIDLRTVMPWDRDCVFASVAKTNRCCVVTEAWRDFGPAGEIASEVSEFCFDDLDAPVIRVASPRVPAPHIEEYDAWRVPQAATIVDALAKLLHVQAPRDDDESEEVNQ